MIYPVTLGYKATTDPYSVSNPHKGIDYANPYGSRLEVAGEVIAKTGNTGYVLPKPSPSNPHAGAHLHVDKDAGNRDPSDWLSISYGVVVHVGENAASGKYISVMSQESQYRFLHLSEVYVKVGDILDKGGDMTTEDQVRLSILGVTGQKPMKNYEQEVDYWTGRDQTEFAKYLNKLGDYYMVAARKDIESLKKQLAAEATLLKPGKYLVK